MRCSVRPRLCTLVDSSPTSIPICRRTSCQGWLSGSPADQTDAKTAYSDSSLRRQLDHSYKIAMSSCYRIHERMILKALFGAMAIGCWLCSVHAAPQTGCKRRGAAKAIPPVGMAGGETMLSRHARTSGQIPRHRIGFDRYLQLQVLAVQSSGWTSGQCII